MKFLVMLIGLFIWTAVSIVWPFSITWWILLGIAVWVAGSTLLFLALLVTATVPNTWYVRVFFSPAMFILM